MWKYIALCMMFVGVSFAQASECAKNKCDQITAENMCVRQHPCKWVKGMFSSSCVEDKSYNIEKTVKDAQSCSQHQDKNYQWSFGNCVNKDWENGCKRSQYMEVVDNIAFKKMTEVRERTRCEIVGDHNKPNAPENSGLPVEMPVLNENSAYKGVCLEKSECEWEKIRPGQSGYKDVYVCVSKELKENTRNIEDLQDREKDKQIKAGMA